MIKYATDQMLTLLSLIARCLHSQLEDNLDELGNLALSSFSFLSLLALNRMSLNRVDTRQRAYQRIDTSNPTGTWIDESGYNKYSTGYVSCTGIHGHGMSLVVATNHSLGSLVGCYVEIGKRSRI